jgi:hypothetical protein
VADPRSGTTEAVAGGAGLSLRDWRVATGLALAVCALLLLVVGPSLSTIFWLQALRVVHVFAAIVLVGVIFFNTFVLLPSLKRIPPAYSTVVSQKIGGGLMIAGTASIILLGLTGFFRLYLTGQLSRLLTAEFMFGPYGRWVMLMLVSWLFLLVTGTLSGYWYQAVLTKKLPYSAGLRDLEEKRAAQDRITLIQDWLYYLNVVAAALAALGGAMTKF